jgi:hypothetical protein
VTIKNGNVNPGDDSNDPNNRPDNEGNTILYGVSIFYLVAVAVGVGMLIVVAAVLAFIMKRRERDEMYFS